jgi:Icc protein
MLIVQLSDTHLVQAPETRPESDDHESHVLRVCAQIRQLGIAPDLVLLTGDLTDSGSAVGYQRLRQALESLAAPFLAIPGNHDDPWLVEQTFGSPRVRDLAGWRIIGLDTTIQGRPEGRIDVDDTLRLVDSESGRPTLLAMHHPPVSPSSHPWFQLDGGKRLLDELRLRPGVRGVVSGHLHQAFSSRLGHLKLLGCPSTAYSLVHTRDLRRPGGIIGGRVMTLGSSGELSSELVAIDLSLG